MYKTIALLLMLVASVSMGGSGKTTSKATSTTTLPAIVSVYTLAGCPDCAALKARLRQSGVQLQIKPVQERFFETFPTVIYSNHKSDNGQRVRSHRVRLSGSVEVYEAD